jgi:hypothetical protein
VVRPGLPQRPRQGGQVDPAWRAAFLEFPDRFLVGTDTFTPERWHYVVEHAQLVAPVAGRPAARRGRTHRLRQRRALFTALARTQAAK